MTKIKHRNSIYIMTILMLMLQASTCFATKHKTKVPDDIAEVLLLAPDNIKWEPAFSTLPEGATMAILEGNPQYPGPFTIRLKLPAHYELAMHWHASDEHITLISGTMNIGFQDSHKNKIHSKKMTMGSYVRIPARMHSFLSTSENTIVQLHGQGPWEIHFLQNENEENDENNS